MLEALSSAFIRPSEVVLLAPVVVLVTMSFMAAVGPRMMQYSYMIAVLLGCVFVPIVIIVLAFLAAQLTAQSDSSGFRGAGIMIIALLLSIGALPITLATSVWYVVTRQKSLPD